MPRGTKRKLETPSSDEKPPKKIKLDLKHDAREENQLPAELVLQLFRQLDRGDIVQCTMVCRQWYRIGQREEFEWVFVASLNAIEFVMEYHFQRNTKLKTYATLSPKELQEEILLWQSDPLHSGKPVRLETQKYFKESNFHTVYMYDDKAILVAIARVYEGEYDDVPARAKYTHQVDYKDLLDFSSKNSKRLWKYSIEEIQEDKVSSDDLLRQWKIGLSINVKELDAMIVERKVKAIPNDHILLGRINTDWWESSATDKTMNSDTHLNRPLKSASVSQPDGFKDDIKLFNYQLDAITWMKSIEDRIGQESHPSHGGILADGVGLGKTLEVLGLVLAAPPKTDLEPHPELIASKSTLIMCPEHLCQQWHDEITRATTLSALVVRNYEELKKCTYEDFMTQYDVIVCAYKLLNTFEYACLPLRRSTVPTKEERNASAKRALEQLQKKKKKNFSKVTSPIIEHFFFHRVVFDEGHLSATPFKWAPSKYDRVGLIKHVYGHSKWHVSATPFGGTTTVEYDDGGFVHSFPLKEANAICQLLGYEGRSTYCYLEEMIFKHYFWRNTKESVKDEFIVPAPVEDVFLVEPTPTERAIHFACDFYSPSEPYLNCSSAVYKEGLHHQALRQLDVLQRHLLGLTSVQELDLDKVQQVRQSLATERDQAKAAALEIKLQRLVQKTEQSQKTVKTMQNAVEILEEELPIWNRTRSEQDIIGIQQKLGTKMAALVVYLKNLFEEKPDSRVAVFSMTYDSFPEIPRLLCRHFQIHAESTYDNNAARALEDFQKERKKAVIFFTCLDHATGANLLDLTHVVLMDMLTENREGFETQAIGHAYRQGQTKPITVVRILFKDTIEHEDYLKKNNMPLDELIEYDPETWKPDSYYSKMDDTNPIQLTKLGKSGQNNTNKRKFDR